MSGLEGVIAAETRLSGVDGLAGQLILKGHSLDDLAEWRVEDIARLLLEDFFDLPAGDGLAERLAAARVRVFRSLQRLGDFAAALDPVETLRLLIASWPDGDDLDTALDLIAAPAVCTPAIVRLKRGLEPVAPDAALGHSADILRMLRAEAAEPVAAQALDRYLVTVSDHGLNASTFVARIVASTRAGLVSSVTGALSAFKGPLHGGAPGPVIAMLDAIGTPDRADGWIAERLDRGGRLMGFGHRVYRTRDPRADAVKRALGTLRAAGGMDGARIGLAEAVEQSALTALRQRKPDRPLDTNVEFYTALLLEALGWPAETFTCVFAMGRTIGWVAHAAEQRSEGRLIRPESRYVGPPPVEAA